MNNLPQVVKFNNQDIPVFFHENKPYVAMRPICENIGLDWAAQYSRIKRNHILSQGVVMMTTPSKGGKQEFLSLPVGYLNGWLFGIDVNRVKAEIKDTLIKYQLECFDVLYKHFMPNVAHQFPNTITIEQQQAIKEAVHTKVHREGKTYQAVYNEFYKVFNIPRYQELPLEKFHEAMAWLGDGFASSARNKLFSQENYELIREFTEAVLSQNFMMQDVWKALMLINKEDMLYYSKYVLSSNELARKVSIELDFKTKRGLPLVSEDLRSINLYGGCRMGTNPIWFNAPAW